MGIIKGAANVVCPFIVKAALCCGENKLEPVPEHKVPLYPHKTGDVRKKPCRGLATFSKEEIKTAHWH